MVIDIYCWRKHGHNEYDEQAFTQQTLYKKISSMQPIGRALGERLVASGEFTSAEIKQIEADYNDSLEAAFKVAKKDESLNGDLLSESTAKQQPPYNFKGFNTRVTEAQLQHIAERIVQFPEGFNANKKIIRQLNTKLKAFNADSGIDCGMGEALAFCSLLMDVTPVRLSGQDSERGTFSHRHSVLYDNETCERYVPLLDLQQDQAQFCVHNSLLSEAAVLGFDYGYSLDYPQMLSIWEAQFGDFVNGAKVIIDQFITCSE